MGGVRSLASVKMMGHEVMASPVSGLFHVRGQRTVPSNDRRRAAQAAGCVNGSRPSAPSSQRAAHRGGGAAAGHYPGGRLGIAHGHKPAARSRATRCQQTSQGSCAVIAVAAQLAASRPLSVILMRGTSIVLARARLNMIQNDRRSLSFLSLPRLANFEYGD